MDAHAGAGAPAVTRPSAGGHGPTLRPTVFGLVVALVVVLGLVLRPPTADPSVTGLVVAALAGAWVLGVVWPLLVVRNLGVRVTRAPTDLVAGQLGSVELELTGRASGLSLACTGSEVTVLDVASPGTVRLPLTIGTRGVYGRIRLDVASDAPFGILWVRRTRVVELPAELLVGPVAETHHVVPSELPGHDAANDPAGTANRGDVVRSVRPYVVGDPAHLLHWPTSARLGDLVVRELEPPAVRGMALVLDLDPDGLADDSAERAASAAAGAAEDLLVGGARVVLCTAEAGGPVTAEVSDHLGVQRRLARAVGGPAGAAPEGWPVHVIAPALAPVGDRPDPPTAVPR